MDMNNETLSKHPHWKKYAEFMRKYDFAVVLLSIALFVLSFYLVKNLKVRSDFKEMLPEKYESVIQFNNIEKRTRSVGNLIMLVGNAPWDKMRAFIDDFRPRAEEELKDMVSRVDTNAKEVSDFYDHNKYLYIDLDDLQEVRDRLKRSIDYEKLKRTHLYIEFGDEEPKFDTNDIEDKYKKKAGNYLDYKEGYFTTPDATLAAVILKPREGATNVEFAEKLIDKTTKLVAEMDPAKYDPDLKVGFGGRYQKMITEYKSLVGDILKTTILCLTLVGALLLIYYRRVKPCLLMTITVMQGTLIALAIGYLAIGYLTSQTAFLGSIIVGNGINFSIIFMSRFLEERRDNGREIVDAIAVALSQTWKPTLTAASTTSASFLALMLTNVRSFSQFGFIGGMGMTICWGCTYFFLPSWLSVLERIWPTKVAHESKPHKYFLFEPLGNFLVKNYKGVLKFSVALSIASIFFIAWYAPNAIEYNFENLRFKPAKETGEKWELAARDRINDIFGQSTTPSVVLADRADQAEPICEAITKKAGPLGENNLMDQCKTLNSLVPTDQDQKLELLADMREMISGSSLNFLNEEQKKEVDKFLSQLDLEKLSIDDIPKTIVNNFEEVDGSLGKIVFVYPKPSANLWNGKELIRFADLIREVDLPSGEKIYSSGEPVIFADLLHAMVHEGPLVTMFSFIMVLILIVINFRHSRESVFIMFSLVIGILWLVAALPFFRVKLNFLNFIALPISFGIGVDYAVNIYQRYKQDGKGSVKGVIKFTGAAVMLCSLTTVIGYSVILTSRNMGLQSFGLTALLGEITCLSAALISLPSFITWLEHREEKKNLAKAAENAKCTEGVEMCGSTD